MSVEGEIKREIANALASLTIEVRFDCDDDLVVAILHEGSEIHSDYIELDKVFLKIEP